LFRTLGDLSLTRQALEVRKIWSKRCHLFKTDCAISNQGKHQHISCRWCRAV